MSGKYNTDYPNYRAKVKYHRTDDLKEGVPENGADVLIRRLWTAEEGEKFAGQEIFYAAGYSLWLPECDLEIGEEISFNEWLAEEQRMRQEKREPVKPISGFF